MNIALTRLRARRPPGIRRSPGFVRGIFAILICSCAATGCARLMAEAPAPCSSSKTDAARHACLQRAYEAAEKKLSHVYNSVRKKLGPEAAAEMLADSRDWIRTKDYICGFQAEMQGEANPEAGQALLYQCLLDYTTSRATYLRKAFGGEGVAPGLPGNYDDGQSGLLSLQATTKEPALAKRPAGAPAGETYEFRIEVVRGPTFHIGEISGTIRLLEGSGVFAERPACLAPTNVTVEAEKPPTAGTGSSRTGEPCCRLDFVASPVKGGRYRLQIIEHDCGYHHGARAYFDGVYRKVG